MVFNDRIADPKLTLIGKTPMFHEDKQGKSFVGKTEQLLDKIFLSVGLTRAEPRVR